MTFDEIVKYCTLKPHAEETYPFDEVTLVMKIGGKMFALLDTEGMESINLKHDSEYIPELLTNEVKYGNQSPQFAPGMSSFLIKMKYNLILYRPPCGIFKTSENTYNNSA